MSGIFGVVAKKNCMQDLFYGTDYHSHLATDFGGLAVLGKRIERKIHDLSITQFKSAFYQDYVKMQGNLGIGVISNNKEQPIKKMSSFGEFAICMNGRVYNHKELVKELLSEGVSFSEISEDGSVNQTELIANLIAKGKDVVDGIEKMYEKVKGSVSLLLLSAKERSIYASADRFPLVIGKKDNNWAITSETCAFHNLEFEIFKELKPKEVVAVNEEGLASRSKGIDLEKICAFLFIYAGFPAASYRGVRVETARERCGAALAKRDGKEFTRNLNFASGIPDSGTTHGIGYAIETRIPFRRPLIKYTPGWDRSYTPEVQEDRDKIAFFKIIPVPEIIRGHNFVLGEDSIVRGTQLKRLLHHKVRPFNPKGVHIRPACPPLMDICLYNISIRTREELAAREAIKAIEGKEVEDISAYLDHNSEKYKEMVEHICKKIGATTLRYQRLDDMVEAIGLPKEKLCLHCWTGSD